MGSIVRSIRGLEIYDSRGYPTIQCDITLEDGTQVSAKVPSGASTGSHEAIECRDGDKSRLRGRGVQSVIKTIESVIAPAFEGKPLTDLSTVDATLCELDGTANKSKLGANATLAVSIAMARALAHDNHVSLFQYIKDHYQFQHEVMMPVPMMNILNGGAHADNSVDIQEFMVMPIGADSFAQGMQQCAEVYHTLKDILMRHGYATGVGDEGGFAPNLPSNEQGFEMVMMAIEEAGYKCPDDFVLSIDVAGSELYHSNFYRLMNEGTSYTSTEWVDQIDTWVHQFPVWSVEDAMHEDDWGGWQLLTQKLSKRCLLVGDDVFVTNTERLTKGINNICGNAILIKPNQIGTVSETIKTIETANQHGYTGVVSHRSGETDDTFIVDMALACGQPLIKTGAPCRGERIAKYNRLLAIERDNAFTYWGRRTFNQLTCAQ